MPTAIPFDKLRDRLPFGAVRDNVPAPNGLPTTDLGMGLMDYHARFYSPSLGRFTQPDSIIPNAGNPQSWNRYRYVLNSPINFNDPTGHMCSDPEDPTPSCDGSSGGGNNGGNSGGSGSNSGGNGGGDGDDLEEELTLLSGGEPDYKGCKALGLSMDLCHITINGLKKLTLAADVLALLISVLEMAIVDAPLVGGIIVGGLVALAQPEILLGLPEAIVAFFEYDAAVANGLAPFENTLGFASLITTTGTDFLEGNTYVGNNGDYYLGTATAISIGTTAAGMIPEANIDGFASGVQMGADLSERPLGSINISQLYRIINYVFRELY